MVSENVLDLYFVVSWVLRDSLFKLFLFLVLFSRPL